MGWKTEHIVLKDRLLIGINIKKINPLNNYENENWNYIRYPSQSGQYGYHYGNKNKHNDTVR